MQIADRFHLHQNLMEAVNKILSREIAATTVVSMEESINRTAVNEIHGEPAGKKKSNPLWIISRKQKKHV